MKRIVFFCQAALVILMVTGLGFAQDSKSADSNGSKLMYADFQNPQNGRPVSNRGGRTQLNRYSQNPANPPEYRGMEKADPPAPALARVTAEDVAAAFEYEF